MPRTREGAPLVRVVVALMAAGALVAGCTTTVGGHGSPGGFLPSGAPSSSGSINPGGPRSPLPGSPIPSGSNSRPPNCPANSCHVRLTASIGGADGVAVWSNDAQHSTIVVGTVNGAARSSSVLPDESPAQLSCQTRGEQSNCILVDLVGAHGSIAHLIRDNNGSVVLGATASASTPTMAANDLNGDGWVDVVALQNDYQPSYVNGHVYWQTWLSDGTALKSSGCSGKSTVAEAAPAPTAPLTGSCP